MKRIILILSLFVALLFGVFPASASPCDSDDELSAGQVPIGDGNAGTVYVDDRNFVFGNGLWLYVESNGVFNLQRGGSSAIGESDICDDGHPSGPDTLVF